MLLILAFISLCKGDAKQYLALEFNKGSYEIRDFGKCYCYTNDFCYKYSRKQDNEKIFIESKYPFSDELLCEGTPETKEYRFDKMYDGIKYSALAELPKHSLHYFESLKEDCSDENTRPRTILPEGHCETNYYGDFGVPYNRYFVEEEEGKKKIIRRGFNDTECNYVVELRSQIEVDTCSQIERAGDYGKFFSGSYEDPGDGRKDLYVGIEYNKGSIEMWELGRCYCFVGDGCYKYEKKDATTVEKYAYEEESYCESETEPTPTEYKCDGTVYEFDMKFILYKEIPKHFLFYMLLDEGVCALETSFPVKIFTEDNCERKLNSDEVIYRSYILSEDGSYLDVVHYSDNECTTEFEEPVISELDANTCSQIEGEGDYGTFIPEPYEEEAIQEGEDKYLGIEYNVGSIKLYELGECYCFSDGCYKYEKKGATTVYEYKYEMNSNCEGLESLRTPYIADGNLDENNPNNKDMKYQFYKTIPEHEFYYILNMNENCEDETPRPINIYIEDNCERDVYSDEPIYRKYEISEDGTKVDIAQYSDNECTIAILDEDDEPITIEIDIETCLEIQGEGNYATFISKPYEEGEDKYVGIEYNKGSIEMYELGKCYCFANDGCYKYEKNDDSTVYEYKYPIDSSCHGIETNRKPYIVDGTVDKKNPNNKDMKFQFYKTIPDHQFYYIISTNGECTDKIRRPINIFTEDNCERDFYSEKVIYRTYEITGEANAKKVKITQYSDNECTMGIVDGDGQAIISELDANTCSQIEGEGDYGTFIPEPYEEEGEDKYVGIEYNVGSIEMYEIGKCYCFSESCIKYEKKDEYTVEEYKYTLDSKCESESETIPTDHAIDEVDENDMKYQYYKTIPQHDFHYIMSTDENCEESTPRPIKIFKENNCERDAYLDYDEPIYRKYEISDDGSAIYISQYSDNECTTQISQPLISEIITYTCRVVEGFYSLYVPEVYKGDAVQEGEDRYIGIEYNVGSFEFYELGECYCNEYQSCTKFEKINDEKVMEYKYDYKGNYCPEGTETSKDELDIGATYTYYSILRYYKTIPDHQFYVTMNADGKCNDNTPRPITIYIDPICESDTSGNKGLYVDYEIIGEGENKQMQFTYYDDYFCTNITGGEDTPFIDVLAIDKCIVLQSKDYRGIIYDANYNVRYLGIEYHLGSIELYELGKCYCFGADDGCFKYIKIGEGLVLEEYYKGVESNCKGIDPIAEVYNADGTVYEKDLKYRFYNSVPPNDFYYIVNVNENCEDESPRPINIFNNTNCERDFYSNEVFYRKYTMSTEGGVTKVHIDQYYDNECTKIRIFEAMYEGDSCLENKVKFNSKSYELSGGKSTVLIMMIIFIIFMLF